MLYETSVDELFKMAITAERQTEVLYRRLMEMFAAYPDVVAFWQQYATEETVHARWLTNLRDKLTPEQLAAPADADMLKMANRVLGLSMDELLTKVQTMDDAYELVNELENSETNAICEFLIDNFAANERAQAFLRSQLKGHVTRLMTDLPAQFRGKSNRQSIQVSLTK
jgi:rubrerythrin